MNTSFIEQEIQMTLKHKKRLNFPLAKVILKSMQYLVFLLRLNEIDGVLEVLGHRFNPWPNTVG